MADFETPKSDSAAAEPADLQGENLQNLQGEAFADFLKLPYAETIEDREPASIFLERIPIGFAREKLLLGLRAETSDSDQITVAFSGAASWPDLDVVARRLGQTMSRQQRFFGRSMKRTNVVQARRRPCSTRCWATIRLWGNR